MKNVSALSEDVKLKIRKQITERVQLGKLEKDLSNPNLFEIKKVGRKMVFPSGVSLDVLSQDLDGTLVVGVPRKWIMPTQDFFDARIAAEYRADPKLKSMSFEGTWLPDGRVMIFDQHHRTQAYYEEIGDPIPFRLKPNQNDTYASMSYLYPMQFYTTWGSVSMSEKHVLIEKVSEINNRIDLNKEQKFEALRNLLEDLYLKTLRLNRTQN
jgi:hypothetical protein